MPETLIIITAVSLLVSLILWRLLTAQNNKAQAAYSQHRKEHHDILTQTKSKRRELKLVLNAIDDALIIINQSGIIQIGNDAAIKLCNNRPLKGRALSAAFISHTVIAAIAADTFTPDSPTARHKHIFPAGTLGSKQESAWLIDTAPLSPDDSSQQLYRIILRNITPEHQADQIKREFVANASHELRTPLAIISGYLENLLDDDVVDSPATARRFLTTMRKHSDRITRLVDEMLTISKLEDKESANLNPESFSLNTTIATIIDRLTPMITAQSATIRHQFSPAEITLHGDPFYWEQALTNLIENALKQNTQTPIEINITATLEKQQLQLSISDNGKGIPAAHLPYIFNRFYRVEKHHSQNQIKGTGLGLSIVKHAIEAHGGSIKATSSPGIITTFTITADNSNIKPIDLAHGT